MSRIRDVDAVWLHCPIPEAEQPTSDFGRLRSFDTTLVTLRTEDGLEGYGEAKAAVGSEGACESLREIVKRDLAPMLVGEDSGAITRLWQQMYNGSRAHFALSRGRVFPVLARRGLLLSAIGAVDLALWDLKGKRLGVPVVDLLGGACRERMPAYASGGWADADRIGDQLLGYVDQGFGMVKMRVGVMDGTVERSVQRVRAARAALGDEVEIAVDAHGTFSLPEAKRFCGRVEELALRWLEEPIGADDWMGRSELRAATSIPLAAGESEFSRFEFRDLIQARSVDVLQPDLAICGGLSEGVRIGHLAEAHQLELAPHLWTGPIAFQAGLHLAFSSPAATVLEYSLGANPVLCDLPREKIRVEQGYLAAPTGPGLGATPDPDFVREYAAG